MLAEPALEQLVLDGLGAGATPVLQESFRSSPGQIIREIHQRNGEVSTSTLRPRPTGVSYGSLADAYDAAWLRADEAPMLDESPRRTLTAADLFSGCGGMSLGFREACRALGFAAQFVFANDISPVALAVYRRNFAPRLMISEGLEATINGELGQPLTESESRLRGQLGEIDFVLAGPPCQGHSDLNNHSRRSDPKNQLVIRVTRFVEVFNPTYVLIENVQGIRHDHLGSLEAAKQGLRSLGYSISEGLLPAVAVGVAQTRRRYFLFASREDVHDFKSLNRPWTEKPRDLQWAIGDLLEVNVDSTFDSAARPSDDNRRRINFLFEHDLYELPDAERPPCHASGGHTYKGVYGRMRWDQPAPTITTGFGSTGQGRFVHPMRRRTLTPHEAARVQFFPDFFDFGDAGRRQLQELIGNAVPPKLAYAVTLHQLG